MKKSKNPGQIGLLPPVKPALPTKPIGIGKPLKGPPAGAGTYTTLPIRKKTKWGEPLK